LPGSFRLKVILTSGFRGRHFGFPMSGHVGSVISQSGLVGNVGVAVEIALPSLYISFRLIIISTSGFVTDIFSLGCQPMSGHVGSVIS
jgi:hypothetical protein